MFTLGIIFFGIGAGLILFGLAFEEGLIALLGAAMFITGLTFMLIGDNRETHAKHVDMLRDVKAEGWQISSSDIKADDESIMVECATFDLIKIGHKWVVAAKRPEAKGGGHFILDPSKTQTRLRKACP